MLHRGNHKRWLKRIARVLKYTLVIVGCVVLIPMVVALGRVGLECRPWSSGRAAQTSAAGVAEASRRAQPTVGLPSYARSEDQTYLTLPEWYIVYSADEYAAFIAHQRPSRFPYFRAVGQFWQSYYDVCAVTRDHYAFNGGYHLSLAVIGTSFTIENILKGLYENTVGRLAEWLSSPVLTEEDAYARAVAVEYGGFLHTVPWYEFPFGAKLGGLWRDTPFFGHNIIRKAERKGALSVEYGTKAGYGWAIRQATQGVYAAEDLQINAWVEGLTPELMAQEPDVRIVRPIDGQAAIIALPRYEAFTQIVPRLSRHGVRFVEIAGNDEILVTLIAPQAWAYDLRAGQALFAMPILTQPEHKRVAIKVPVALLHRVLNDLADGPITLEHIYDY